MAYRGGDGGSPMGGLGPMAGVVMVFIGLVVVAAIQQFAPTIGGSIERSQPAQAVTSKWNTTYNTNMPEAADMYSNNAQMGNLLVLIIIVSLILAYLIRI